MSNKRRLCVFSDMHFMAWKDTNEPVEWVPNLVDAIADAVQLNPDAVIVNGDLTNGKERDYRLAIQHLRHHCTMPIFFTMGNHEYYGRYEDDPFSFDLAQERFLRHTQQTAIFYEQLYPEATLIFLSPEKYCPDEHGDAAWLSESQLAWFETRLLAAPIDRPVIVFLHQPINDTVADSTGYCVQSDQVRTILKKRPGCLFISGHTHCRMDRPDQLVAQDGTVFVGGGCVCNDTPQSRWLDIGSESVILRIRDHNANEWVDDYQFNFRIEAGRVICGA